MLIAFCIAVCCVPLGIILTWFLTERGGRVLRHQDRTDLKGIYDGEIERHYNREEQLLDRLMAATQSNLGEVVNARALERTGMEPPIFGEADDEGVSEAESTAASDFDFETWEKQQKENEDRNKVEAALGPIAEG